jgi:hypothetical protein
LIKLLNDGEVVATEVRKAANKEGISIEALRRAKGSLGIRAVVTENGNVWKLPQHKTAPKLDKKKSKTTI